MAFDPLQYMQDTAPATVANSGQFDPVQYMKQTTAPTPTLESQYLEPNAYPVAGALAKGFDIAATPFQTAMSIPVQAVQAAHNALTDQPQQDFVNPITSPLQAAKQYGSTTSLFSQMPGMNTPIDPDIAQQSGVLGQQFPKAANVLSQISPADVAGSITDTAAMAGTGALASNYFDLPGKIGDAASDARATALTINSGLESADNNRLVNTGVMKRIGDTLNQYNIAGQLSDPPELLKTLGGEVTQTPTGPAGEMVGTVLPGNEGIISQLNAKLNEMKNAINNKVPPMDKNDLVEKILNNIAGAKNDSNSTVPFNGNDELSLEDQIVGMIKPDEGEGNFSDLIKMKQNSQARVFNMSQADQQNFLTKYPSANEIYQNLWSIIDDHVNSLAAQDPDVADYVKTNQHVSDLLTAKNMLEGSQVEQLNVPSDAQAMTSLYIGRDLGVPFMASRDLRQNVGYMTRKFPAAIGATQQRIANAIETPIGAGAVSAIPSQAATIQQQSQRFPQAQLPIQGRQPNSVPADYTRQQFESLPQPIQQQLINKRMQE